MRFRRSRWRFSIAACRYRTTSRGFRSCRLQRAAAHTTVCSCWYSSRFPRHQRFLSSIASPLAPCDVRRPGAAVFPSRPARLSIELHDLVWEGMYLPLAGAVGYAAGRLNHLQFLTIRRYLSLVFATLVTLLLVLAIWS